MKKALTILLIMTIQAVWGQHISIIEKQLNNAFQKIGYWSSEGRSNESSYDSLAVANAKFEKLLLQYTNSNPQTLSHDFKSLIKNRLTIATSEDGQFRIYSWDTWTGGTMHFFKNVFQYKAGNKVHSTVIDGDSEGDPKCFYYQINDIVSQGKKYYLTQSTSILSTGLSSHRVKIFAIENGTLNDNAQLIKTKTGIKNQLGYEVDFTASSNRNNEIKDYTIEYDPKNKIISIPLILDDSKVTAKKIRYQFKGKYFEKI